MLRYHSIFLGTLNEASSIFLGTLHHSIFKKKLTEKPLKIIGFLFLVVDFILVEKKTEETALLSVGFTQ
jgi:hypothetical protein